MKEERFERLVCLPHCRFYKGGKEDMACAGLVFFQSRFRYEDLNKLLQTLEPLEWDASEDEILGEILCKACDFAEDGCGFREGEEDSPPCGGYVLLELMLRRGLIDRDSLN